MDEAFVELRAMVDQETSDKRVTARGVVAAILAAEDITDLAMRQFRRDVRIVMMVTGRKAERILDILAPVYERCWDTSGSRDRESHSIVSFLALYQTALFQPDGEREKSSAQ